jgi:hypothetical protein
MEDIVRLLSVLKPTKPELRTISRAQRFLQFPGDSKAFCYWQDPSTIIIYPDLTTNKAAIAQAIGVGSVIVVKPNNNIKAICPQENSGYVSGAVPPFQSHLVELLYLLHIQILSLLHLPLLPVVPHGQWT